MSAPSGAVPRRIPECPVAPPRGDEAWGGFLLQIVQKVGTVHAAGAATPGGFVQAVVAGNHNHLPRGAVGRQQTFDFSVRVLPLRREDHLQSLTKMHPLIVAGRVEGVINDRGASEGFCRQQRSDMAFQFAATLLHIALRIGAAGHAGRHASGCNHR